jgi:hypothetical protein
MPYEVKISGQCPATTPWAVVKTTDGKIMGCHSSKSDAEKQQAALYVNEPNLEQK